MWDDSLAGPLFSSSPVGGTSAPLYPELLAKDEEEVNCSFCWTQLMRLCKPVNTQTATPVFPQSYTLGQV